MRRAKLYRLLAFVVILLFGLFVVLDVVVLQVAESKGAAGFARATAAEHVTLDLGGFPFLPGLVTGHLRKVELDAAGLTGGGLRVQSLTVSLRNVRLDGSGAVALIRSAYAGRTRLRADMPVGRAEVGEPDLDSFVRSKDERVKQVRILSTGIEVTFLVSQPGSQPEVVSAPARFLPRVQDRRLVLELIGFAGAPKDLAERARILERSIDLPPIPKQMRVDVRLFGGKFALDATGPNLDVMAGEGGVRSR
jgi:hypothetical protein